MPAKYRVIARELELLLRRSPGTEKLPTEAALCRQYGCSRQTIRSALKLLEEKGLIVRRRGSGSYPAKTAPAGRQIALVLSDREEYTAPALLRSVRKAAAGAGCTVACHETHGSVASEREHLQRLLAHPPAGILLSPICDAFGFFNEDLLARMDRERIPCVFLDSHTAAPSVRMDEDSGAALLAAHLSASGHKKVAAILKCDETRGIARLRSLTRALAQAGVGFLPENCLFCTEQERLRLLDGDDALLRRFLQSYRGSCTAVICHSDEIAHRLLRVLRAEQQEIAVVSYDDSYLARESAITSLGPSQEAVGTAAVDLLTRMIEGRDAASVALPRQLHVRKSG